MVLTYAVRLVLRQKGNLTGMGVMQEQNRWQHRKSSALAPSQVALDPPTACSPLAVALAACRMEWITILSVIFHARQDVAGSSGSTSRIVAGHARKLEER